MSTVAPPIAEPQERHAIQHSGRILELDGVRAIAIALVIGYHYPAFASSLWRLPEFGWIGVDVFFVLSGYLITTNLLTLKSTRHAYRVFYRRRARRILPPYALTVAGCTLISALSYAAIRNIEGLIHLCRLIWLYIFFLPSFSHTHEIVSRALASLRAGAIPSLIHSPLVPWISNPGFPRGNLTSALSPTWSVSVEEWFYILWAPVVLLFRKKGIVLAVLLSSLVGFLFRWLGPVGSWYWYTDFFCRLDTLALGAALALWFQSRRTMPASEAKNGDRLLSGAGLISAAFLVFMLFSIRPILGREIRDSSVFAAFGTPLIGITAAAAIAWILRNASNRNLLSSALRSRALVYIGRRSYTIYLVHVPCYWFVSAFFGAAYLLPRLQWIAAIISLALTLFIAAVSWKMLEAPLLGIKS